MRSLSTVNSIYCHCNIIHHAVESVRHKNKVEIYKTGFESVKNVNFVAVFINPINFSALEFTWFHKTHNASSVQIKKDTGIPCVHMQRNLENQLHGWHPVMSVMSKVLWLRRLCSLIKLVIFSVIPPWEILVKQFRDIASQLTLTWKISFPSPMGWAATWNELCPPLCIMSNLSS